MNIQEAHRLTGQPISELFEKLGKTTDIELEEVNPFLMVPESEEAEYVTVKEAAKIIGYSEPHIYKLMADGKIDHFTTRTGRKYPYKHALHAKEQRVKTNIEIVEDIMQKDPSVKYYLLGKYGIDDMMEELRVLLSCLK